MHGEYPRKSPMSKSSDNKETNMKNQNPRVSGAAVLSAIILSLFIIPALPALAEEPAVGFDLKTRIERDWMVQDHGPKVKECFTSGVNADVEGKMIAKALGEMKDSKLQETVDLLVKEKVPGNDQRWKAVYIQACENRRAARLAGLRKKTSKIVFTKHFNMGGSHYAYTEAVSDAIDERHFEPGTALCLMDVSGGEVKIHDLIKDKNGVIRDPDVSYDGKRVLFAWKKADREDDYHLYEMDLSTRKVRQLTYGLGVADYEGCYLPSGEIIFNSTRCIQIVDCWITEVSNIYVCDKDGKNIRRLGFDQVHTNYPQVLEDGRVIYTRWDYNDRGQLYPQPLFQMNMDGTGQTEYYGNNSWFPTTIMHARGIPGSQKLIALMSGHHCRQRGKLGLIDASKGRQEAAGVQLIAPVQETKAEKIDAYGQQGDQFQYPYPINEREYIVGFAPVEGDPGLYSRGTARDEKFPHFGIYYMDIDGNRELLAIDAEVSCNQPVLVMSRPIPAVRASQVDYRKNTGSYYVQDVYYGPGLQGIPRGTVKKLRVVAIEYRSVKVGGNGNGGPAGGAFVSTCVSINNGTWDVKRVLGEADVHEDGSAFFEVPARTPLYFQLIDATNQVVQTMRTWSTLMPGENASCIGCHEDKNSVPPSAYKGKTMAMKAGVQKLKPFYGEPRGFSYVKEIQPILDRNCIKCHVNRRKAKEKFLGHPDVDMSKAEVLVPKMGQWKVKMEKPGGGWDKKDYDDSSWPVQKGGFGSKVKAEGPFVTSWDTKEIWLRNTFDLPVDLAGKYVFIGLRHEGNAEIWINGIHIGHKGARTSSFEPLYLSEDAMKSLHEGKNTIAVLCKRHDEKAQSIDVTVLCQNIAAQKGPDADKPFSLLSETGLSTGGRNWSDSYLYLTMNGKPNDIVQWMNVQSIPPMIPPYMAGSAKSKLMTMLREGHQKVKLSREDLDKIACWIDLLVPYCGDYLEANAWNDDEMKRYNRMQNKREIFDNMELESVESYVKQQSGGQFKIQKRPYTIVKPDEYRNVAWNPYDVRGDAVSFPHASANSECRDELCFLALNAINGKIDNKGHGMKFPSWGPDKRTDLWWNVEFGKTVEVDKAVIYIRADFPHDAFWKSATLEFSDGSKEKIQFKKVAEAQTFPFAKRAVTWMKITDLVQDEPLGWAALTQVEVWGKDKQ